MINLKRSFFWAALYLAIIFVLGEADFSDRAIINFANYFYLAVMVAIPATLFFPSISRVSLFVPLIFWAGIYLVMLQTLDRGPSATAGEFSVIVLEFVLLEVGVWFAHQLAVEIGHADSLMDVLALGAFPNNAQDIETSSQRIKVELTRSRRYHRPLSLLVLDIESSDQTLSQEMLKNIQHDMMVRFTSARVAQVIDDRIRQTDLVMRDRGGRFVILCPETIFSDAVLLAKRISQAIEEKTGFHAPWGVAAFPDEALTFEDLLLRARERLLHPDLMAEEQYILSESGQKVDR